ncbi:MAG: DUF4132 domain-containing protein [Firmicutes bacterium]|nr:DUF4132 domain-containing protein [Bacillota bacterium]MCL2255878.1 DUF4132 domain-containing protein [Bacillota bacterium]
MLKTPKENTAFNEAVWLITGQKFFSNETNNAQKKDLLKYLLSKSRFEELCAVISCGTINKEYANLDFVTKAGGLTHLDARKFNLFLDIANEVGITEDEFAPLLVRVYYTEYDKLQAWQTTVESYFLKKATENYDKVLAILTEYDVGLRCYHVLMKVDADRTFNLLVERLIFFSGTNKREIRKWLLKYNVNYASMLKDLYMTADAKTKSEIVKLLLMSKNDPSCSEFLSFITKNESSQSVQKIITKDYTATKERVKSVHNLSPLQYFEDAMVRGRVWGVGEFQKEVLANEGHLKVAEQLFFAVFDNSMSDILREVMIIHEGKTYNLDNKELILEKGKYIRVLHMAELPSKYDIIKRLAISQDLEQVKRKIYVAEGRELTTGVILRLQGTMVDGEKILNKMKDYGFVRVNNFDDDGEISIGKVIEGFLITFEIKGRTIAQIKLHSEQDAVRLQGKLSTKKVPTLPANKVPRRVFSELMHSVHALILA